MDPVDRVLNVYPDMIEKTPEFDFRVQLPIGVPPKQLKALASVLGTRDMQRRTKVHTVDHEGLLAMHLTECGDEKSTANSENRQEFCGKPKFTMAAVRRPAVAAADTGVHLRPRMVAPMRAPSNHAQSSPAPGSRQTSRVSATGGC